MQPTQHVLTTSDGTKLEADIYGVRGPTVVLLPGMGGGIRVFRTFGTQLAAIGYRVAAMNYRGAGSSEGRLDGVTLHDLARDVASVIEFIGPPAAVLGRAFGNRIARCTGVDYPDLVRCIVLVCAGGQIPPKPGIGDRIMQIVDESLPDEERIAAAQETMFAAGNPVPPDFIHDNRTDVAARMCMQASRSTPLEEWQSGGDKPMLVIQGAQDMAAPRENALLLKELYPDRVTLHEIADAGHAVLSEKPEQVATLVREFLEEQLPVR